MRRPFHGLHHRLGRMRSGLLGLAVGLALADSSIVTLALPEILGRFDVGITTVAWVLTSFNLVLALVAVPAALLARRAATPSVPRRRAGLRRRVAGLRARSVVRAARRRALRPGGRGGVRRRRCSRSSCRDDRERSPCGARLGDCGRPRRGVRAGCRRHLDGAARLEVDLLRAGTARPRCRSCARVAAG